MDNFLLNKQVGVEEMQKGLEGEFLLPLQDLCIALTNRCNLYCAMCPFCAKEYSNRTYNNEEPFFTTLEEYKNILTPEVVLELNCVGDIRSKKKKLTMHFTHGESLLNPQIAEIAKFTKQMIPNSTIRLSSNGTIHPQNVTDAEQLIYSVDHFCFSIDGCTKEVFERLRTPAKYDNVLKNLRAWSDLAKECGKENLFRFTVTLSAVNLPELEGLVRLAAQLGGYYGIAVQPLVVDERHKDLERMKLEYADKSAGRSHILNAKLAAEQTGIALYLPPSVKNLFQVDSEGEKPETPQGLQNQITPFCDYFQRGFLELDNQSRIKELCCNMAPEDNRALMERYGLLESGTPVQLYNSLGFWQLRLDMIEGMLRPYCKDCLYCSVTYNDVYCTELPTVRLSKRELRETICGLRAALEQNESALDSARNHELVLKNMIQNRDSRLETLSAKVDKQQEMLKNRENMIQDRDSRIETLSAKVDKQQEMLKNRDQMVINREAQIDKQSKKLIRDAEIVADLNTEVVKLTQEIEEKKILCEENVRRIKALETEREAILSSFGGKIYQIMKKLQKTGK